MADTHETITDIIAEMRFHGQQNIDAEKDRSEYGILTAEGRITQNYADRLEAAHRRMANSIHRAMVILAGIEMPNPDEPPRLWTALEDAYDALSDALGTDGDTTADEEEARTNGRHFMIQPRGDCAKLREALEYMFILIDGRHLVLECKTTEEISGVQGKLAEARAALAAPPRNCDRFATADEAFHAWNNTADTPSGGAYVGLIDWLFAPATEKEGGVE